MNAIGTLYDTLKKVNDGSGSLYSIHKKLNYSDSKITNLYDYLLNKYNLMEKSDILDCGCGVGFGTILLAKKTGANLTGISVSPNEIESALANLKSEDSLSNVTFVQKSFDELKPEKFDAIIAIESLKHSVQLSKSLDSIIKSLKTGGDLYIIEDVVVKPSNTFAENRLKKDWVLSKLYTEKEYIESSENMRWFTFDMTSMMRKTSKPEVASKIIGTEIKTVVDRILNYSDSAASIFRGGFYQEWLYLNGTLRYKLMIGKKL